MAEQLAALAALRFNWAPVPDDVWRPSPFHIDGLHPAVSHAVLDGLAEAKSSDDASAIGLVLQGERGSGKTHLLGWLREQTQLQGGYFFLVSLLDARGFWDSVLAAMLDGLSRPVSADGSQLRLLLRRLASRVGAAPATRRAVTGEHDLTVTALDDFMQNLAAFDEYVVRSSQDTARALALGASRKLADREIAEDYFAGADEETPGTRRAWGMRAPAKTSQELIGELSRLLALTGPSVIAVDQIDTLIAQSALSGDFVHSGTPDAEDWQQLLLLEHIAGGLMSLREVTRRTLTVLGCLPTSWTAIKAKATDSVQDRFREAPHLKTINDRELARRIVEKRLGTHFERIGFTPPYPTWPITPGAFHHAAGLTPRQLLQRIDEHVRSCQLDGIVTELNQLEHPAAHPQTPSAASAQALSAGELEAIDHRFEQLKKHADIGTALDADTEDAVVPALLATGLAAWMMERADSGRLFTQDPPPGPRPALHARLRLSLDENTEDQAHWCFRAISDRHHGNASLNRIRQACLAAGLDPDVAKRKLYLLRNGPWSTSSTTRQALAAFERAGGRTLRLNHEDLRILTALQALLDEEPIRVQEWIAVRRPTEQLAVLQEALADTVAWAPMTAPRNPASGGADDVGTAVTPAFTVGTEHTTGAAVGIHLASLRKHAVIFAGSGSGKTVLIRRIVEECALQGVSSIVLDPNNDLARMGETWPEPPPMWNSDDPAKAEEYLENTDVIVWTPRRAAGRPLSFQPMPDFAATADDPDEFAVAVETAVASLAPRAKLDGRTNKSHIALAVLRRAVEHYGKSGGSSLKGLIDTLAEFPDDVANLEGATKIAAGLAQTLTATMINDPLFGGEGAPVDPGTLLTPPAGKRARISVISLVGLPGDELRQSFVNQLQMALFAWIKKNPAADRPLLGLLVMDEAQILAPSGAMTACTQSSLALAAQARKYGLGLIFATQAPKGLHNRIAGNAATQFFGRLNSPIQIEAAREMAKAKGGDVPDISRLTVGEFYLAAEGEPPSKLRTPICLSYHPQSPLTTEEVLQRAHTGA
ncbi:ATP-binding protein [Catellatospora citrea]|uniref:ATPase n=1 Tax=Catellatospora citrea TaxID=53366 RepID=A0A8J3KDE2_9ACTN|nr:ATP-binding protein [Catellatospora citrea]RKE10715.1 uncharacterized protein DUF87 [Catellatospora citrea]GIG01152.1 ATPase [Catellatospora citrea]